LSGSTAFRADAAKFTEMAKASVALGKAYVALAAATTSPPAPATGSACTSDVESSTATVSNAAGAMRELSAARLHLRGVLSAARDAFADHPLYADMSVLLEQVQALEAAAKAARQ
jgi:hypothetical protein